MALRKITKRLVDDTSAAEQTLFCWDTVLSGFGLKVTPAGKKLYIVQFRPFGGRKSTTKRISLGEHGRLTPDEARKRAKRILGAVADGRDPSEELGQRKRAPTVADIAPQFLDETRSKRAVRTTYEYTRQFAGDLLPVIGKLKIADVTRQQIAGIHNSMRDHPYAANRTLALASAFFAWAAKRGFRQVGDNPCRGIDRYPEQSRERYLTHDEMSRLGEAFSAATKAGKSRPALAAIRFLVLSGFREQEALTLRWDAIDFERSTVTLAQTKTGKSTRHLGAPALELLASLSSEEGNPFVFPGLSLGSHLTTVERTWQFLKQEAKLEDVRLHDLRHSFASAAVSGGMSLPLLGALLGHKRSSTTERYAHMANDPRKEGADRVASEIHAALRGVRRGKVLPIRNVR